MPVSRRSGLDLKHNDRLDIFDCRIFVLHHSGRDAFEERSRSNVRMTSDSNAYLRRPRGPAFTHRMSSGSKSCRRAAPTAADHPRSIRASPVVVGQKDVSRMGVGMEEAVDEDLLGDTRRKFVARASPFIRCRSRANTATLERVIRSIVRTRALEKSGIGCGTSRSLNLRDSGGGLQVVRSRR